MSSQNGSNGYGYQPPNNRQDQDYYERLNLNSPTFDPRNTTVVTHQTPNVQNPLPVGSTTNWNHYPNHNATQCNQQNSQIQTNSTPLGLQSSFDLPRQWDHPTEYFGNGNTMNPPHMNAHYKYPTPLAQPTETIRYQMRPYIPTSCLSQPVSHSNQCTVYQPVATFPQRSEMDILMEKMNEENLKAEREHEEKMKKMRAERVKKNKLLEEQLEMETKQEELKRKVKDEEEWSRMNQEQEELKRKNRELEKGKLQMYEQEMESLKACGDQEKQNIEDQRQREKWAHETIVNEKNERFFENSIQQKKEEEMRNEEFAHLQAEQEKRVQQIYIDLEIAKEEMRRKHQLEMDQMEKQWEQIMMMLKYRIWNEIIEKNWTNRLNVLRSSNQKVAELFNRFYREALVIQRHIDHSESITKEKQLILPVLKSLIESIEPEKKMLEEEVEKLDIQGQNTGRRFVFCIKESVEKIKCTCGKVEESLKLYLGYLEKEDSISAREHKYHLEGAKKSFDDLSKHSSGIPTMAELKHKYSGEMKHEPSTEQDFVPSQTVIIEEVE